MTNETIVGRWTITGGNAIFTKRAAIGTKKPTTLTFGMNSNGSRGDVYVGMCSVVWDGSPWCNFPYSKEGLMALYSQDPLAVLPENWRSVISVNSYVLWGDNDFEHAVRRNEGVWYISNDANMLMYEWYQLDKRVSAIVKDGEVYDPVAKTHRFFSNSHIDEMTAKVRFPFNLTDTWTMEIL